MKISQAIGYVARDRDKKSLHKIIFEVLHCAFTKRELPLYYFTSLLHQRDSGYFRDYISHGEIRRITNEYLQAGNDYTTFEDKLKFKEILDKNSIPSPHILAHTSGKAVYQGTQTKHIHNDEGLIEITHQLMRQNSLEEIFVKPADGIGGEKSFKIFKTSSEPKLREVYSLLSETDFLYQEVIAQHSKIDRIYSKSVNTLRIHTYLNRSTRQVEIVSGLMRFGSAGSVVDNGSLFVPIDIDTWTLCGPGKSLLQHGGQTLTSHPDSGTAFEGFQIPFGTAAAQLVREASLLFDSPFVGWDVAVTPDGPVLIEGNHNPHLIMAQIATRGIRNHPRFMRAFQNIL